MGEEKANFLLFLLYQIRLFAPTYTLTPYNGAEAQVNYC